MSSTSTSSIVPVLVDQFNEIIHWREKILKDEVTSFEQQKVATPKILPYFNLKKTSSSHDIGSYGACDVNSCDVQKHFPNSLSRCSSYGGDLPLSARKSRTQKQFSRKLNRARVRAESNTINETTEYEVDDSDPVQDTDNFLQVIRERLAKCRSDLQEVHNARLAATPVVLLEDCDNLVFHNNNNNNNDSNNNNNNNNSINNSNNNNSSRASPVQEIHQPVCENIAPRHEFEPESKPLLRRPILFEIKQKILPRGNRLLEKLENIYRHGFVVKTIVVEKMSLLGSRTGFLDKDEQSGICCACGESYMFSDKHLQCITCLTRCHTTCGSVIATPCVKFVDPYLKPSRCISAYVFPRARPSIPCLILHCVREIEHRLQQEPRTIVAPPKLYYVDVQKMKTIKDECRRLIMRCRLGVPPMRSYTFDYLSGMVKLFLGDICEPVFGKEQWKEYAQTVHRKTDSELKEMLIETIDSMPQTAQHTLCFMLFHLKHLIKYEFQDIDIIVSVFCPILMGDIDVRRKIRLFRIMLNELEDNVLLSFVEH